jgi:hypothetical protein
MFLKDASQATVTLPSVGSKVLDPLDRKGESIFERDLNGNYIKCKYKNLKQMLRPNKTSATKIDDQIKRILELEASMQQSNDIMIRHAAHHQEQRKFNMSAVENTKLEQLLNCKMEGRSK